MTMLVAVVFVAIVMTACLPIRLRWHRRRELQPPRSRNTRPLRVIHQALSAAKRVLRRLSDRLREFADLQVELSERRVLLNRPWEEDLLHWARDDNGWRLHGSLLPPGGRRRRSTTSLGWCPAMHTTPDSPSSVPPGP